MEGGNCSGLQSKPVWLAIIGFFGSNWLRLTASRGLTLLATELAIIGLWLAFHRYGLTLVATIAVTMRFAFSELPV